MAVRDVVQAAAGVGGAGEYVEDVFSTYLYTGNNGSQTIENGVDLAGEGGMVWMKSRNATYNHGLMDTARGTSSVLCSNLSDAAKPYTDITSFNSNGFTLGFYSGWFNSSGSDYASWTWRKSPSFFDVVTYTGNGVAGRTVAHNLGSEPGFMLVKATSSANGWNSYHRSLGATYSTTLSSANASYVSTTSWNSTAPTSTEFTLGTNTNTNANGVTYVAYLFAHDAGGFGDDGEQNVISCGSYTGNGAVGNEVTLGFEPQWLLVKSSSLGENWWLVDVMRGMPVEDYTGAKGLRPNTNSAEATPFGLYPTATGFVLADGGGAINENNATYIYMAIRRPMKTPESGTEVFAPVTRNSTVGGVNYYTGFPVDFSIFNVTTGPGMYAHARLTSGGRLQTVNTNAEIGGDVVNFSSNVGYQPGTASTLPTALTWNFKRAPGFFDVVAYTGTGSSPGTQAHNLGVVPEFVLTKKRNAAQDWYPHFQNGSVTNWTQFFALTSAAGVAAGDLSSYISESTFSGNVFSSNNSGSTYVAYLFATLAGVSKVGSYTGTGADLNVDCGFSAGARFILIKRTDSTGDWYVWDSTRGIVVGDDPYLLLNSTAAQVTNTDYIDPLASGFTVTSSAPAALNASGGTYIFLAIA